MKKQRQKPSLDEIVIRTKPELMNDKKGFIKEKRRLQEVFGLYELKIVFRTKINTMTSELAYLSNGLDTWFGEEYLRRLNLLGFSDKKISEIYEFEKFTSSNSVAFDRNIIWINRYLFNDETTIDELPDPTDLSLSELILITNDANNTYLLKKLDENNDSKIFNLFKQKTRQALFVAAPIIQGKTPWYISEYIKRTKELGFTKKQAQTYVKNEHNIIRYLKSRSNIKPWRA